MMPHPGAGVRGLRQRLPALLLLLLLPLLLLLLLRLLLLLALLALLAASGGGETWRAIQLTAITITRYRQNNRNTVPYDTIQHEYDTIQPDAVQHGPLRCDAVRRKRDALRYHAIRYIAVRYSEVK